jgi:prepilin-type N-terminal cleavage/methylation domain-containing protein
MNSPKTGKSTSSKSDDGFTLLEITVGLVVISLIGVVVWQGASWTGRLFEKISSSVFSTVRTVQLDRCLRDETARVKAPFWVKEFEARENEGHTLSVPYLDGDADSYLVLEFRNDYIRVGRGKRGSEDVVTLHSFGPFEDVSCEIARSGEEREYGIKVSVRPGQTSKSVEIVARFGSNPF